jgi:hypothetical protein
MRATPPSLPGACRADLNVTTSDGRGSWTALGILAFVSASAAVVCMLFIAALWYEKLSGHSLLSLVRSDPRQETGDSSAQLVAESKAEPTRSDGIADSPQQVEPEAGQPQAEAVVEPEPQVVPEENLLFPVLPMGPSVAADRTLGTSIVWAESVSQAAEQAMREEKLVFVVHLSGDFEQQEFT